MSTVIMNTHIIVGCC